MENDEEEPVGLTAVTRAIAESLSGLEGHSTMSVAAVTVKSKIDCVRFLIANEETYEGADGAFAANLDALLTAGLLADGTRDLAFVA